MYSHRTNGFTPDILKRLRQKRLTTGGDRPRHQIFDDVGNKQLDDALNVNTISITKSMLLAENREIT